MLDQVIIIGGGLSGVSAAHTALEHGARVLLLDKSPYCGGNSTKATSGLNACVTKTQIANGIADSVDSFEKDTVWSANLGKEYVPYRLARVLTEDSAPAVEWLTSKFKIDLSLVSRLGGHSFPRTHRGKERFPGMTITYGLLEKLEEVEKNTNGKQARIVNKAIANKLITDKEGNVIGVEYKNLKDQKDYKEYGVVVICSGGFAADFTKDSLLMKYRPDLAHMPTTNGAHCTGDGIKMCQDVGGELVDMEWIQTHPTGLVQPSDPDNKVKWLAAEALRGCGGIIINANGERICDELGRRDYVSGEMHKNKAPFRLVLNSAASKEIEWHCKHYVGRKLMKFFTSGKDIAKEMNIPVENLEATFREYTADGKAGKDKFGKKYFHNSNMDINDSYHVAIITPVVHYCMGGVKISDKCEVMNKTSVIPGVYAAGEVAGGVHGKNRLGGNSLGECVVFGRIAGAEAANHLLNWNINKGRQNKLMAVNTCSNSLKRIELTKNQLNAKKEYTWEDVKKHNTDGDCWVVIRDQVYDVSQFMVDHPGGKDSILLYAGGDATEQFELMHQDTVLRKYGPPMCIGKLAGQKLSNNSTANTKVETISMEQRRKNVPELLKLTPSNTQSKLSGGTAHILPEERKNASFDVKEMVDYLNGGPEFTKKRKFIESVLSKDPEDQHRVYNYSRHEYIENHVKEFIRIHRPFKNYRPTREEIGYMSDVAVGFGGLNNSHAIFLSTITGQGNEQQTAFWLPKIMNFEITGSYAQTELGHGSNVRGLQTIAEFDKATDSFILNTPTLASMKWWPGCLGKIATHVVLYAQLLIDGKEYGVNVFVLQIRDENHLPLPGIRLGDLGNKIGDNANDTGFMILDNVRIPRTHMLSKYRTVNQEGKYVNVVKADPKVHYTTMMTTRANMVSTSSSRLAQAATVSIRYSCVREQGFKNASDKSFKSAEFKIMDHKIQQYRLLKQLSHAYALKFTGRWMLEQLGELEGKQVGIIKNTDLLKELASTSAGLKSLTTIMATNGIEDCRKCCGGNGYLLSAGLSAMSQDYLWQVTAEGDYIILALLTAKHILKSLGKVMGGMKLQGVMDYFNVLSEEKFEMNQIKPVNAKFAADFCNLNYLLSLFRYRSIERNVSVAKEFNNLVGEKEMRFEDAFNHLSNDLLKSTHIHCYYIIMMNFVNQVQSCKSEKLKKVLNRLCIMFACSHMLDENWGETISKDQYRLIRECSYNVMKELRPDSVPLVDSFDIPDSVLRSAIGRYDGNVYEALFDAAQKSILNQIDPFVGYEQYLRPHTNKELLKRGNVAIPNVPAAGNPARQGPKM
jgi:flavocytochrome c